MTSGGRLLQFLAQDAAQVKFDVLALDDTLHAGPGIDIRGSGNDLVEGGEGQDILLGFEGDDRLHANTAFPLADAVARGETQDAQTGYAEWLDGGAGQDQLVGGKGADILWGDAGADALYGGADGDKLVGDLDADPVALQGADYLDGGAGNRYVFERDVGNASVVQASGAAVLRFAGFVPQDLTLGASFNDVDYDIKREVTSINDGGRWKNRHITNADYYAANESSERKVA